MEYLSVSQVQLFLTCPLKYRFSYVDKLDKPYRASSLAFGTSVHAAIEWYHRARQTGRSPTTAQVLALFDADWYAANLGPVAFAAVDSPESLRQKGRALVALYVERREGKAARAVEEPFEIDLVDPATGECLDVKVRGVLDLVEEDGTVVDLKTAARAVSIQDLERHLQLSVYALVAFLKTDTIPSLRLDVLLKTKTPRFETYPTTRTIQDLSWTAQLLRSVASAIAARTFHPAPSWACGECEFFAACQAWRGE